MENQKYKTVVFVGWHVDDDCWHMKVINVNAITFIACVIAALLFQYSAFYYFIMGY